MKNTYFLILLVLLVKWGQSQSQEAGKVADILLVDSLLQKGNSFLPNQIDSAEYYINEAYNKAKTINYKKGEGISLEELANTAWNKGNFSKSITLSKKALEIYEQLEDFNEKPVHVAKCYNRLGDATRALGDLKASMNYFIKSLEISEKAKDTLGMAFTYNNLGILYVNVGDNEKALAHFELSIKLTLAVKSDIGLAKSYQNIGAVYELMGNYELGFKNHNRALETFEKENNIKGQSSVRYNLGMVFFKQNKLEEAIQQYLLAEVLLEDIKFPALAVKVTMRTAYTYSKLGNENRALTYLKKAQLKLKEVEDFNVKIDFLYTKSLVEQELGNHEQALLTYVEYIDLDDSLRNIKNLADVEELSIKYQTAEKDKEIAELAQKETLANLKTAQQEKWLAWMGVGLLVIIMLAILLITRSKSKRQQQEIVFIKQRAELEQKALRAQMNPHFTYNALNSIQSLIASDKADEASIYLAEFSKLMRLALEASINNEIAFEDEVSLLEKYLILEKLRFKEKFDWSINPTFTHNNKDLIVPPMFIQPIVENALVHGILKSATATDKIEVNITMSNENILQIVVLNSGNPLHNGQLTNDQFGDGLSITEQRLVGIDPNNSIVFESLEGNDMVTKVTMTLNGNLKDGKLNFC